MRSARSAHLGGGLLPGDVEGAALVAGRLGGHLEQQRALADTRLAGQQDRGTRHQAAAEHPVESGTPLLRKADDSTETSAIGTAALVTGPASARRGRAAADSATEPQAWHSPQRPTHFGDAQPHSEQR